MNKQLRHILKFLLTEALAARMTRQKSKLARGLFVELYITPANALHLLVWRYVTTPSLVEWRTVLAAFPADWPTPADLPDPSPFKNRSQYALTAHWPIPRPDPVGAPEKAPDHVSPLLSPTAPTE